jgi:LacI family transcriptional regulator
MAEEKSGSSRSRSGHTTLMDISKELGVSIATVSRVINDKPGVGVRLRERVLSVVRKHKYIPRASSRDLAGPRRHAVGVVLQDLTAGWLLTVFRGVLTKCTLTGYNVLTTVSTREEDVADLPLELLNGQGVDGFIWLDPRVRQEHIDTMKAEGVPFVLVQNYVDDPDIHSVSVENTHTAHAAAQHLLGLGHRNVVVITGPKDDSASQQRLTGVQLAFKEQGSVLPDDNILRGHYDPSIAADMLAAYFRAGHRRPDAIFAFNDAMAIAALQWLRANGHRVPEDIAVMGFDGIEEARKERLTTVETPIKEMGMLATQILVQLIEHPDAEPQAQHILLKGKLAIRDTCGTRLSARQA